MNTETEHEAQIEEGGKGQFDVLKDGELVFSRQETGRFPEREELRSVLG